MSIVEFTKGSSGLNRISQKQEGGTNFTLVLESTDDSFVIQEFLKRIFDYKFPERIEILHVR